MINNNLNNFFTLIQVGSKQKLTEALVKSRGFNSDAERTKAFNKIYDEIRHIANLLGSDNIKVSDYSPISFSFDELDQALTDYYIGSKSGVHHDA